MEKYNIRPAAASDAQTLSEIYAYYVKNTAVTFENEPPSPEEIKRRIEEYSLKYPYLVIEAGDEIIGFAFAHAFRQRPAYDYSAETSIYMRCDRRHAGFGKQIYTALENGLRLMGVKKLYACIAVTDRDDEYLNCDSPRFHEALGYRKCGEFKGCGRKFGRWYDMIWMEKAVGELTDDPAPISPYPEVL